MPSKDPINEKANAWMEQEGIKAPSAPARRREIEREVPHEGRQMSGTIQRLARNLGKSPDEIASKLPADTIRRTKYPVIEQRDEQGRRIFIHDQQIVEGRKASLHK